MKQESISDMEHSCRKKKTKREEFLEIRNEIIPWDEWPSLIVPRYSSGKRGRPPSGTETMLRMYLLQCWFNLSDEGVEDAIYDSYAMRRFMKSAAFAGAQKRAVSCRHRPFSVLLFTCLGRSVFSCP